MELPVEPGPWLLKPGIVGEKTVDDITDQAHHDLAREREVEVIETDALAHRWPEVERSLLAAIEDGHPEHKRTENLHRQHDAGNPLAPEAVERGHGAESIC